MNKKPTSFEINKKEITLELKQKLAQVYFEYYHSFYPHSTKEQLMRQAVHSVSLVEKQLFDKLKKLKICKGNPKFSSTKTKFYYGKISALKETIEKQAWTKPRAISDPVFENPFIKKKAKYLIMKSKRK